ETMTQLRRVYNYAFHDGPWPRGYFTPDPRVVTGPFDLGDLHVSPFDLPHGNIDSTGYLFTQAGVKKLAYLSDCKEVPEAALAAVQGVEVAVLDALRPA